MGSDAASGLAPGLAARIGSMRPAWILFAVFGLLGLRERPSDPTIRVVDLVSIIGPGRCFGVPLMHFIFAFQPKNPSS
jgi:hypothetical protein